MQSQELAGHLVLLLVTECDLPFLGVRFISIGDGFDSSEPNAAYTLTVMLRNLLNEVYSMDISRKSGSILRQKQQRGEFIRSPGRWGQFPGQR